jgi:hypothetical protein
MFEYDQPIELKLGIFLFFLVFFTSIHLFTLVMIVFAFIIFYFNNIINEEPLEPTINSKISII